MTTKIQNPRIRYDRCPLCASDQIQNALDAGCTGHPLFDPVLPETITWAVCEACNHIFTEGYFSREALGILLSRPLESRMIGFDLENQRQLAARAVNQVLPFKEEGQWLDVGVGNGSLMFTAAEFGFFPVGVDILTDSIKALANIGFEVHGQDFHTLDQPGRYDVISMADGLPCMPFPAQTLAKAHELLKDDGILYLSLPNSDSVLWVTLNNSDTNPWWGELEHYHNFGRNRLFALLRQHDFEPLHFGISATGTASMEVIAGKGPGGP